MTFHVCYFSKIPLAVHNSPHFPVNHPAISKSTIQSPSISYSPHPSPLTKPPLTLPFLPRKVLETLAVHPSHQRKGLGTLLIKTGLDLADRDRARTYIEASAKGLPLYLKHGWEPVGATVVDMRKYGGGGEAVVTETTLIRLPKTVG